MNCFLRMTSVFFLSICCLSCSSFNDKYVEHYGMTGKKRINFHKQNDNKRRGLISECAKKWEYHTLKNEIQLKVLQYEKAYHFDMFSIPAILIGISESNDTLRILKLDYKEEIRKNQIITIVPDTSIDITNWQELTIAKRDVPVFLARDRKEDRYFCDVKETYFGNIMK